MVAGELGVASPGGETDVCIEQWLQAAIATPSDEVIPILIKALDVAESEFVKVRVASALAIISPNDNSLFDSDIADAIANIITQNSEDDFLYTELLKILGVLGTKNTFAFADIRKILLRVQVTDSEFRIIAAAKVMGWLENAQNNADLRSKLDSFENSENDFVQAELEYQQAILAMSDALLANNLGELQSNLQQACLRFQRAAAYEEQRDDAQVFALLLDLLLEYFNFVEQDKEDVVASILQKSQALISLIYTQHQRSWYGYRNQREQLLMLRIWRISEALQRIAASFGQADTWTNFDEALVEMAAAYTLLLNADNQFYQLGEALSETATRVIHPQLGLLMNTAIGRVRLAAVIERYVARLGEDEIAVGLRALYKIAEEYGNTGKDLSDELLSRLAEVARREGQEPDFFLKGFLDAFSHGQMQEWLERCGYLIPALPIDASIMLGNAPQIDWAVRPLIKAATERLDKDYSLAAWKRFTETCVALVQIVQQIRDDLPLYTLSAADNKGKGKPGKGQQADEGDLQEDLFARLRLIFRNTVGYEITKLAGGRSDTGLKFPECEFPIEVKAEYKNIDRQHIHSCYLAQPDTYASVRDRISFLIVLDLRVSDSGSSIKKKQRGQSNFLTSDTTDEVNTPVKLYSLKESFWVDSLSVDPQIQSAARNVVVIGLVPGNRRKPSSLTTYSRKPTNSAGKKGFNC
jgi:hypothetical protein